MILWNAEIQKKRKSVKGEERGEKEPEWRMWLPEKDANKEMGTIGWEEREGSGRLKRLKRTVCRGEGDERKSTDQEKDGRTVGKEEEGREQENSGERRENDIFMGLSW